MSQESFSAFRANLAKDDRLREELSRALGPNGTAEGLAAFARKRGYDVDPTEIKGALGELSDEELDSVGGGTATLMKACCTGTHFKEVVIE